MRRTKIDNPNTKAEGKCCGIPYNTELVSINGVSFHFWIGDADPADLLPHATRAACAARDVVCVTYSDGEPTGYWASNNIQR